MLAGVSALDTANAGEKLPSQLDELAWRLAERRRIWRE